jgi:hypothetical protein
VSLPDDWRLMGQERYLSGVELTWRSYRPSGAGNDHDHCEFCQRKSLQAPGRDALREGYATPDGCRWICKGCFDDFAALFGWRVR